MPIFDMKSVGQRQLQDLIDNKVFENKELEYKDYSFAGGKIPDKQKDKFMKRTKEQMIAEMAKRDNLENVNKISASVHPRNSIYEIEILLDCILRLTREKCKCIII